MVQPQIGKGNKDTHASNYDAIDLLDYNLSEQTTQPPLTSPVTRGCYTIDSDEEDSTEEDSTSGDDDPNDNESSEEESSDDDEEEGNDSDDANSADVTEVVSNVLNSPSAQHHSSPAPSSRNNSKRSIIPPASSFRSIGRKLPSYMTKSNKNTLEKDNKGHHQHLPTTDDGMNHDEENNLNRSLMKEPINSIRDPAQFPIEQYTDVKYGQGQGLESYTYATSDPSDVQYTPKPLRKMESNIYDDLEQKKRKIVFLGLLAAIFICFLIAILSFVEHVKSKSVSPPIASLETICDISNISTEEGHQECELACQEAKCCMAPGTMSCFKGQEKACSLVSFGVLF